MNYNRQQITKMVNEYLTDREEGFVDCFEDWFDTFEKTQCRIKSALAKCKDYEIFDHECDELP